MSIPVEITWTAGQLVTAAQLNANVRDAVNYLLQPPVFVGRQLTGQVMAASGYTGVTWETEDRDNDAMHSLVTNTNRATAVTPGWYDIASTLVWPTAGIAAGYLGVCVQVNGATRYARSSVTASNAFNVCTHTSACLFLNAGDYIETLGINGTAGAGNLSTADGVSRTQVEWRSS